MNIESFQYSLFATVLGMLVVFIFLGLLIFLMISLKTIFKEGIKGGKRQEKESPERPDWLFAAVSAYLAGEEEDSFPYKAKAWKADKTDRYDPWIVGGRFLKRGIGD